MSVRIDWIEVTRSQLLAKTVLDDESEEKVGLFMMVRQLVHRSREEHDLHRLIACGLNGVIKMK
jgi:hypothetical protein